MFYLKERDENGNAIDANGVKWALIECSKAQSVNGVNIGFTEFNNIEECCRRWGLTLIEEESINQEEQQEIQGE